jgi:hypothetical protein
LGLHNFLASVGAETSTDEPQVSLRYEQVKKRITNIRFDKYNDEDIVKNERLKYVRTDFGKRLY